MDTSHLHNKLCGVTHYRSVVQATPNEELLKSIDDLWWIRWEWPIHRYYLRLLKQEAHRRGLRKGGGGASLRT